MRTNLLTVLLVFPAVLCGANMWMTHGHDYSYSSPSSQDGMKTYFPVIWDMRTANSLLSDWHRLYNPTQLNPIYGILQEAAESGFNTVIVRAELADRWFPEMPGTYGDKFFPMAGSIRELGLNVMPGGFSTTMDCDSQNQAVLEYLKLYIPMTEGDYPGEITGMFCFDEPDVKYLEYSGQQQEWMAKCIYWSDVSRNELGLSVLSFLSKYGTADDTGYMEYYSDTTCVLNRLARYTDMVGMGMYPAKNNFRRTDLLETSLQGALFTCATDLVQDDPLHCRALNCRDELVRVFPEGDSALALVENIVWDGLDLHLETAFTLPLDFLPDNCSSSDFRAGYAVHEAEGYVNSGVVLWSSSRPLHQAVLISPVNGAPVVTRLPYFHGSDDLLPFFVSVGQTDFWADADDVEGIIGRGRLAILAGLEDDSGKRWLMLFTASEPGISGLLEPVFEDPRRLYFSASGAIWGTFWGTWYEFGTIQPVARNGFIVHDGLGNYVSLIQLSRSYWQIFPAYGASQYSDLFGCGEMPDFIQVSRDDGTYPPFFAGRDVLTGFFSDRSDIVTAFSLYNGGPLSQCDTIHVTGVSGGITGYGLLRNDRRYSDRPVLTDQAGLVYTGIGSLDTGMSSGEVEMEPVNYCNGDTVFAGLRPMHTRDAIRSVLIGCDQGFYLPHCELYSDKLDDWRFQWYPNAHRTAMSMGIQSTSRDNVLFALIQSYGRRGFALPTYCASPDTMLYMVTAPVVEGARGLVFYAMDMAMMSGNGGDDGYSRAPFILQNWGPSRDTENTDMIGRVHETVSAITGRGIQGTDYLSPLVDTTWTVLNTMQACNADPQDSLLNFIALENAAMDTILIIAANTATSQSPFQPGIVFYDLDPGYSITGHQGYLPGMFALEIHPDGSTLTELDYSSAPPLTASLLTLSKEGGGSCQGTFLETATTSGGSTVVSFSLCTMETGELILYDMAGRRVSTIWQGEGTGFRIHAMLRRGSNPAGMYFLVLRGSNSMLTGKCILW